MRLFKRTGVYIEGIIVVGILTNCSTSKLIPERHYLLDKVVIKSDIKGFDAASLQPYIHQKANSRWFSLFKIPLNTYALSGKDSTKWINRTLRRFGERPVIYDTLQAKLSCEDLRLAMRNMGYMDAHVTLKTQKNKKNLTAIYTLHPGKPFIIEKIRYDIEDPNIASISSVSDSLDRLIRPGMTLSTEKLDAERKRITDILQDEGYFHFHKDFINFTADTIQGSKEAVVTLHLQKYRENNDSPLVDHKKYYIRNVMFNSGDSNEIHLRGSVLENNCRIKKGDLFNASNLQQTYNNFGQMGAIRYTNISFKELPDTNLLDCNIQLSMNKPSTISFQPEGTNTAGDLGAAVSLTYQNRNLFKGSELFSVEARGAFEAITGLEGYQNQNYNEYSLQSSLEFPRFVAPFLSRSFKRRSNASSVLTLSYDLQNRPEFHRRVFSAAWRYKWNEPQHHSTYKFDVLDLNYVYMPWISSTFKHDYLDDVNNRNAILRYNYEDLFIMKMGFNVSYNNGKYVIRAGVETSGNILNGLSLMAHLRKNKNNQYTLFNISYAQYAKADFDYTRLIQFDTHNSLALHADFGIAYPYGNSTVLPFEKRYFAGGANSVRGWNVRGLGPGKFRGTDGRIDFINQTGDMKLDLNMEYRTWLFWKVYSAIFVDAGNIWTLRNYADQPGGQFKINEFYKQIAVAYGLGIRFNFNYFILRFDMGMKAINPAYTTSEEHYAIVNPDFSRDFVFHFAVGLPF